MHKGGGMANLHLWNQLHDVVGCWLMRKQTRHALAQLDGRALRDVGISRAQRAHECAKWFWQK
jgi:uncharacterized protein YjiS (DUF1127 family)